MWHTCATPVPPLGWHKCATPLAHLCDPVARVCDPLPMQKAPTNGSLSPSRSKVQRLSEHSPLAGDWTI